MTLQMKLFNDLRFFIGLFFLLIGLILIAVGTIEPSLQAGVNLDLMTGFGFVIFSAIALTLAVRAVKEA